MVARLLFDLSDVYRAALSLCLASPIGGRIEEGRLETRDEIPANRRRPEGNRYNRGEKCPVLFNKNIDFI